MKIQVDLRKDEILEELVNSDPHEKISEIRLAKELIQLVKSGQVKSEDIRKHVRKKYELDIPKEVLEDDTTEIKYDEFSQGVAKIYKGHHLIGEIVFNKTKKIGESWNTTFENEFILRIKGKHGSIQKEITDYRSLENILPDTPQKIYGVTEEVEKIVQIAKSPSAQRLEKDNPLEQEVVYLSRVLAKTVIFENRKPGNMLSKAEEEAFGYVNTYGFDERAIELLKKAAKAGRIKDKLWKMRYISEEVADIGCLGVACLVVLPIAVLGAGIGLPAYGLYKIIKGIQNPNKDGR